jgi:hypothetical protein
MRWVSVRIRVDRRPPSKLRFTRKADVLAIILPHFDFSNPEKAAWRKWKYEDPKFDCAN